MRHVFPWGREVHGRRFPRGAEYRKHWEVVQAARLTQAQAPTVAVNAQAQAQAPARAPQVPGVDRAYNYNELIGYLGGMTPLEKGLEKSIVLTADQAKKLDDLKDAADEIVRRLDLPRRYRTICVPETELKKVQQWVQRKILSRITPHRASSSPS